MRKFRIALGVLAVALAVPAIPAAAAPAATGGHASLIPVLLPTGDQVNVRTLANGAFPAALPSVTAVGGTVLTKADNARGWSESAWQLSSSGCSAYNAKPSWQHDTDCPTRTVADVSAAAQQIAIYNTDQGGWLPVNGTSASAPFVAGVYGLAGNASTVAPGYEYAHAGALFDVTSGTNDPREHGGACGNDYLCTSVAGYDGPTGLGTPNGTGAF